MNVKNIFRTEKIFDSHGTLSYIVVVEVTRSKNEKLGVKVTYSSLRCLYIYIRSRKCFDILCDGHVIFKRRRATSFPGVYDINCRIQQRQASGNGAHLHLLEYCEGPSNSINSHVFPKGVASILKVVSGTVERLKCMTAMMENDYRLDHSKTKA